MSRTRAEIVGLDIDRSTLAFADALTAKSVAYTQGNALDLPFPSATFDLCLCHFFLLWMGDPLQSVIEMRRVTRQGGSVLALAEPDYGGRIDYPSELAPIGKLQAEALRRQGADPDTGRRLGEIFSQSGLEVIETGVMGGQWRGAPSKENWEAEWRVLEADLAGELSESQINQMHSLDAAAWQRGERVLFVPTFYAWGKA